MKLLVFEYSSVCLDENLLSEGYFMLQCLLDDLKNISLFDTYFLVNDNLSFDNHDSCNIINPDCELTEWLNENCYEYDYCLFIAPEDNLIQYNISRILEENNVKLLCSSSEASFICSSKYLTYKNISSNVLKIKTLKMNLNTVDCHLIESMFNCYDFIVKPDNRTSSDLIYHVKCKSDFEDILIIYEMNKVYEFLVQEYVAGDVISVSVLCNKDYVDCISINSQVMKKDALEFEYLGCDTPIEHEHQKELYDISRKIVKEIPGLKGFIGIDYIIQEDEIYFVELNPRITTPFIVLQKECNENLTKHIINLLLNNEKKKITFKKNGKFRKR